MHSSSRWKDVCLNQEIDTKAPAAAIADNMQQELGQNADSFALHR